MSAITLHDAQELLRRKLLINKMSVACLTHQIEYSKQCAVLQVMTMKDAMKKLIHVKKLNTITEKQLSEFTQERQDECAVIYVKINALDTPSDKHKLLIKKLDSARESMCTLMAKIQHLESNMPASQLVTNFHIKNVNKSTASSCGMESNEI